jgi:hypothetical protein
MVDRESRRIPNRVQRRFWRPARGGPRRARKAAFSSFFGGDSVVGKWRIVAEGDEAFLELGDDFKAQEAPDLKPFLSPLAPGEVTGANAVDGAIRLDPRETTEGRQRYSIPDSAE